MVGLRLLDAARAAGLTVMTWRQAAGVATPLRAVNRSAKGVGHPRVKPIVYPARSRPPPVKLLNLCDAFRRRHARRYVIASQVTEMNQDCRQLG